MSLPEAKDPVALLQALINCPSVTPIEGGALQLLEDMLTPLGFNTERVTFSHDGHDDVENLYARLGTESPHIMFAGHTDVVPVGDEADWTAPPFSGQIIGDELYGRGAVDMKGGIACFIASLAQYIEKHGAPKGSVSFLITGDEEGPSINGTEKLLKYMAQKGEVWDGCIVGEPTNPNHLGEMIKIGRRGSMTGTVVVHGKQGHVAYPHLAHNPILDAAALIEALNIPALDQGTDKFPPSNLEITTIDVGNSATNVIPAKVTMTFNIRFNNLWTNESLAAELEKRLASAAAKSKDDLDPKPIDYELNIVPRISPVFLTDDTALIETMSHAIKDVTGKTPQTSTTGGTSDARFIKDYCPVIEFGLVGQTMHMVDERTNITDVQKLTDIYHQFLIRWFER